ncbi:hypothetical protein EVAR_20708_1 [Eumeta japonica]|uniref:Integrase catalytic domain-containing protein n=1 Tax=Eumeta variegata TaxID=151549 RepID=A0A4C1VCJ4_EUMVA|nr:hypothetical protein EVAR_20708_1 [Eumeta japonica]
MLSVADGTHLVVVDAHSKWVEWAPFADGAGTEPVFRRLSEMLGRFGLPQTIVTDNATPFTLARFRRYCEYDRCLSDAVDARPERAYEARLLCPRKNVPKHVAPAPSAANLAQNVSRSQTSQSKYLGGKRKTNFTVGDKIIVKRHYQNGNKYKWLRGTLVKNLGSRMWLVRAHELTQCLKKYLDQLLHWRGGDDVFIQDTPQATYEYYNSDESDDDYTFGADRADERQSAEEYGEELIISKNDSNTTSSSPEGGEEGGDTMTRGYDSTEAENEDANSSGSDPKWTPPPHYRARSPSSPSKVNISRRFRR